MTTAWEMLRKQMTKATFKPTKPERILYQTLKDMGIRYESQYWVGRYRADAYLPDYNVLIEVDGEYWHNKPTQQKRDRRKDQFYKSRGFKVARVQSKPFMRSPDIWLRGLLKSLR